MSAIRLIMSANVSLLSSDASEIITMLGHVLSAHSIARWEASLPMSLIKYQYFTADALSVNIFPINCEYTLDAVSKPIDVWINF